MGIDARILHTPGHTGGSISAVLSGGNAIVGDAAMNFLKFCLTWYRPVYIEDNQPMFANRLKLTEQGIRRIYPAHGRDFAADKLTR